MGIRYIENISEVIMERVSIVDVINSYVQLKQTGRNHKGLCPFHSEKTPSFVVSDEKQVYHCFGCGAAGNVIGFIMNIENLDFLDAIEFISEKYGIDLNQYRVESSGPKSDDLNTLKGIVRETGIYFIRKLRSASNPGEDYLLKRGLKSDIIKKFGLGYVPDEWEGLLKYLKSKGYKESDIEKTGLIVKRQNSNGYYDRFRNRVIFPIIDVRGKVVGFGGRVLDDSVPKYMNSVDSPVFNKSRILYNLNNAKDVLKKEGKIILVEGYMDVISLYQAGIMNAVASLGTALTEEHGKILRRYTDEVVFAYDSDEAGVKATIRGIEILSKEDMKIKIIDLEDFKDPDEMVKSKGSEYFQQKVKDAVSHTEFKLNLLKKEYNLDSSDGVIDFIKESMNIVKPIKSPTEKDYFIKLISKYTNVEVDIVRKEVYGDFYNNKKENSSYYNKDKNSYYNRKENREIEKVKSRKVSPRKIVESRLVYLSLQGRQKYQAVIKAVEINSFKNEKLKKIMGQLSAYYSLHDEFDISSFADDSDMELLEVANYLLKNSFPIENFSNELENNVVQLGKILLSERERELKEELEAITDKERRNEILKELFALAKNQKK
ncbi:MAG: DNA primase [Firmicutes bacterium]|nr:DNA primase [Bacillota bacterium]